MEIHWHTLTPDTKIVFQRLKDISFISEFYLAGGTGLAFQLGHRFSVALDFFGDSPEAVNYIQRSEILKCLHDDPNLRIIWDKEGTLTAYWHDAGVSFFRLDRHPLILEPISIDGIRVASIKEIGAMKLAAILTRGTRKDFVDLYFILQHTSLMELFEVSSKKYPYNSAFPVMAVRALAYFDDAEIDIMPEMISPTEWKNVKSFLEKKAIDIGRQQIDLQNLWSSE